VTIEDYRYDLKHGAPRRLMNDALTAFASTVPADAFALEIGCGHYDHRPYFPQLPLRRLDIDDVHQPSVVGDAHQLPLADNSVDVGLALSVLEHVHDPYQCVREIHRVMKPGGRVLVWVPFFFGVHAFPGDVSRFTAEGLQILFERAGFEIVRADARKYAGVFLNLNDAVHFTLPRRHRRRSVRVANRVLAGVTRAGFPLDSKLKLKNLYAGTELEAVKLAAR
jgi:SAM-dependent methyltransferase